MKLGIVAYLMEDELNTLYLYRKDIPWTILASLWYLLKLINFLSGAVGEGRVEGLPSRQNVRSVRYKPDFDQAISTRKDQGRLPRKGTAGGLVFLSLPRYSL